MLNTLQSPEGIFTFAYSPRGEKIAASQVTGFSVWEAITGGEVFTDTTDRTPLSLVFSPDGRYLAAGLTSGSILLYKMTEAGMKMTAFKSTVTDIMQSGNFIVDIGTYEITMTMPQMGGMPWTDKGKYMTIWEKQDDGTLKIKVETWNTDVNPWEEIQKMQQAPPGESHEGHKH
jgi:ketosteroid isomerase-like protein